MPVGMVHVRHVRMTMPERGMDVAMTVRLAGRIRRSMCVLMVCIVDMGMRMLHRLVNVLVLMIFREMQPNAQSHEAAGTKQSRSKRFSKEQY